MFVSLHRCVRNSVVISVNYIEMLEIRLPTFDNPLCDLSIITDVKLIRIVFSTSCVEIARER